MKILILGYSNLCRRKIVPVLKKKFSNTKFSICSRSQKKKNIGAYDWFRDYKVALKKSKTDVVYISLINSLHRLPFSYFDIRCFNRKFIFFFFY